MPDTFNKGLTFEDIILTLLAIVILVVVAGCIYTFIRAIFLFIFSSSKEENKKKGRNAIRFMMIGLILTIVLLFVFPFLFKIMGVPNYTKYSSQNIFNRAGELVNGLFKFGEFIKKSQKENEFRGNLYYDTTPNDRGIQYNDPISSDYNL